MSDQMKDNIMSTEDNNQASAAPTQATPEASQPETDVEETEVEEGSEETATTAPAEDKSKDQKKQEAEVKKALRSYELKVNGKSKKIDIDLDNDDEVRKYLQKAMASDEKFQEASTYKKQAEQLVEQLQKDPLSILRNPALGLDIRKLAEQVLLQDLEDQQKSPEQKELEEARRKLKDYEEMKSKSEETRKRVQLEEATKRNYEEVENSMIQALEKADIPAEPFFVRRIADIWAAAVENGWETATLEDIMPYASEKLMGDFKAIIGKHKDPKKLEKLLGKDVLDDYRKSQVSKVKKTPMTAQQASQSTAKVEPKTDNKPKRIRIDDIGGW